MAKALTEMTVEILTAQLSHRDMSPDEIAEGLRNIFGVLKALRDLESRRQFSATEIEAISNKIADLVTKETEPYISRKSGGALDDLGEKEPSVSVAFMDPKDSIQEEKIICLECGREFKQISHTHLKRHGLTPKDYRKKYHLPSKQPLTAHSLSDERKKRALESGLGSHLKSLREAKEKI